MKHLGKNLTFLGLALALGLSACGTRSTPESDLKHFFDLLGDGKIQEAYESTAFVFRAGQSAKAFEASARDVGFVGLTNVTLLRGDSKDGSPVFEGVLTASGQKVAFELKMTREKGAWRVLSLKTKSADPALAPEERFSDVGRRLFVSEEISRGAPPDAQLKALVREAIQQFSDGLRTRDFEAFYNYTSKKWQDQVSKVRLYRAFEPFVQQNVDLSDVLEKEPVFDGQPRISPDGLLVINGHYDTHPRKVFAMKFIYELPKWRLFGINVELRDDPAKQPASSPAQGGDGGLK
jgi:hypothetical protein